MRVEEFEVLLSSRLVEVAHHERDPASSLRQDGRQIGGNRGFSLIRRRRGDKDCLDTDTLVHEPEIVAQHAVGLGGWTSRASCHREQPELLLPETLRRDAREQRGAVNRACISRRFDPRVKLLGNESRAQAYQQADCQAERGVAHGLGRDGHRINCRRRQYAACTSSELLGDAQVLELPGESRIESSRRLEPRLFGGQHAGSSHRRLGSHDLLLRFSETLFKVLGRGLDALALGFLRPANVGLRECVGDARCPTRGLIHRLDLNYVRLRVGCYRYAFQQALGREADVQDLSRPFCDSGRLNHLDLRLDYAFWLDSDLGLGLADKRDPWVLLRNENPGDPLIPAILDETDRQRTENDDDDRQHYDPLAIS